MKRPKAVLSEYTRAIESFRRIPETQAHTRFFQPLLERLGYEHIVYCHGSFERGKDFICLDPNRLGESDLTVVQIKNEPLSGRSKSSGPSKSSSAVGLVNQILQCSATKVRNPLTNQEELPRKVVVFSSYEVPDYAVAGMGELLQSARRLTEIIGPTRLIGLIKKHLPELYADLVYPGEGLSAALLRQLNLARELNAIGVRSQRDLRDVFVNIGVSHSGALLHQVATGMLKVAAPGTRLTYSRQLFSEIDSLASYVTRTLRLGSLFTTIEVKQQKPLQVTDPADLETAQRPATKQRDGGPKKGRARKALSERVVFELGDFDAVLRALEGLRKQVESAQSQGPAQFLDYVACISKLGQLLSVLYKQSYDHAVKSAITRVPAKEPRPIFGLQLSEIDPSLLIKSVSSFVLCGEAGAGKTTIARIITRDALDGGLKCLYFPCSRIEHKSDTLAERLREYIDSLNQTPLPENCDLSSVLSKFDLIILDGCDEAATFNTTLSQQIQALHFRRIDPIAFQSASGGELRIPPDLGRHVVVDRISDGSYRATLAQPLPAAEFERLAKMSENREYASVVAELERLQRGNVVNMILTTRSSRPLTLNPAFIVLDALPFNDAQLARFFEKWFSEQPETCKKVIAFLEKHDHIKTICRTPMVATLVAALEENQYALPRSKTDIYAKRFDLLLDKWDRLRNVPGRVRVVATDKMLILSRLAFRIHIKNRARFSSDDLREVWDGGFAGLYQQMDYEDVLWELQYSNNVIYPTGPDEYSFGHLSYQEYLVAREIVNLQDPKILARRFDESWWRQVLVFYAGIAGSVERLFTLLQTRRPIDRDDPLVQEMASEARHSPPELKAFLSAR